VNSLVTSRTERNSREHNNGISAFMEWGENLLNSWGNVIYKKDFVA
jgi:hypothetical protein